MRQVFRRAQLAGRVAFEGEQRVLTVHPVAVVGDPQPPYAAPDDLDDDRGRAGVQGVLDQLLRGARRALDHLARGDLVRECLVEAANASHAAWFYVERAASARPLGPTP